MTEPKLKPCPFCGGEARIDKLYENEWYVYCPKCERNYGTEKETIEAWNRRVPQMTATMKVYDSFSGEVAE